MFFTEFPAARAAFRHMVNGAAIIAVIAALFIGWVVLLVLLVGN